MIMLLFHLIHFHSYLRQKNIILHYSTTAFSSLKSPQKCYDKICIGIWYLNTWSGIQRINAISRLMTSLSGINNTFTPLCPSTIISENWTSRRVTIQTQDVQCMTHLYAIVYPGPVFHHLAFCFKSATVISKGTTERNQVYLTNRYLFSPKSLELTHPCARNPAITLLQFLYFLIFCVQTIVHKKEPAVWHI